MHRNRMTEKRASEIDTSDTFDFDVSGFTITVTPAEDEIQPPQLDRDGTRDETPVDDVACPAGTPLADGHDPEGIIGILIA